MRPVHARWGGACALVGGTLLATKGASIALYRIDPDWTAFAVVMLALSALGVALALPRAPDPLSRAGRALAALAATGGLLAVAGFLRYGAGPEGVDGAAGVALGLAYATGTFGALLALLLLARAAARTREMGAARHAPAAAALLTVPLMGLGDALGPGWSLMLPGLLWIALGLALVVAWGADARTAR